MVDNAVEEVDVGEEKKVKKSIKKHKLIRERELTDLKDILSLPSGKRFLWRVLEHCHLSHSISHRDPLDMSRVSGERDVGLWLLSEIISADKNGYIKLMVDATQRENNDG